VINNEELSGKSIFVLHIQSKCQARNPVKINSVIFLPCYYALEIHSKTSVRVKKAVFRQLFL